MSQMKNRGNKDFSWNIVFYFIAFISTIAISFFFYDVGFDLAASLLMGVTVTIAGVVGCWFVNWIVWLILIRITRGAPFRVGDYVEITFGKYQGTVGKVQAVIPDRYAVRVVLEDQTDLENNEVFYWYELRRKTFRT